MFSVIIPLYNKAHTIVNTLQTVLSQTYTDFEVVIVNDGSTDNSVELIKQFTDDYRIRIINQHNQGVSVARNKGIMEAVHPWISFLDADDEWLPEYLENVKITINQLTEVGMVLMGRYGQNFQTGERKHNIPKRYQNKIQQIEFFHNPHVFAHISATTIKRTLLQENIKSWGGFESSQKSNEDFVFLFRVALHTKVAFCCFPLAIYNGEIDGQATSVLGMEKKLDDSILFHNLVLKEWLLTNKQNKSFQVFIKYELRHIFYINLKSKNYDLIKYIIKRLDKRYEKEIYSKLEFSMYQLPFFNSLMVFFVGISKIRWRLRGYPRVK